MKEPLRLALVLVALAATLVLPGRADAAPALVDPDLSVRTAVSGLDQPISLAFLGRNDMLVLEKATGKVQRVVNGTVRSTVLDLPVNSASERGLLGIALDPHFFVTGRVYLFWSESTTGADSVELGEVPLLGNRVDRFYWNGSTLTFDRNIIRLRSFQADAGQPLRGNHDGGVLRFGPDKKLYVVNGDTGRRGQLQNLIDGPFGPGIADDQFGGPEPDDAHLTGAILRLNDDGIGTAQQPVLPRGQGDRRRSRGERAEDLRLRPSEQLRDGVRPDRRRPLGAGERRRQLHRDQPRRPGVQLRLGADHGPA